MIATNHIDKVVGRLRSALSVHGAQEDFHSALMVILALGQVRPLNEELSLTASLRRSLDSASTTS